MSSRSLSSKVMVYLSVTVFHILRILKKPILGEFGCRDLELIRDIGEIDVWYNFRATHK